MTFQFSVISYNVNRTKDKDFFNDKLCSQYDPDCLQECLLISASHNSLRPSQTQTGLSKMVSSVSNVFSGIDLSLNKKRVSFFLSLQLLHLPLIVILSLFLLLIRCSSWAITLNNNFSYFHQCTVSDISKGKQFGYAKIAPNRGKCNRQWLEKLYSAYSDHSVLYTAGIFHILRKWFEKNLE